MTLKYLKYISTGYPYPPWETVLQFSPGKIDYTVDRPPKGRWSGSCEDFQDEKRIQIETLLSTFKKRVYRLPEEEIICDGECWYLEYQLEGEDKPHKKSGDNAYPPLWSFLMQIIDEVAEEQYTYYSVMLDGVGRSYYYFGNGEELQVGDRVRVPFGSDILCGTITEIEQFTEDDLPLSLDKMKAIKRRAIENEEGLRRIEQYRKEPNPECWMDFPETMWGLGFEFDCFESFLKRWPEVKNASFTLVESREEEERILDMLRRSSTQIVGSFIHSRWRELMHWCEGDVTKEQVDYFFSNAFDILEERLHH